MSKPDPKFFRVLLEREQLTLSECIMVGNDHTTDIAGANAVGMVSVYIQSNHSHQVSLESVSSTYKVAQTQNQGRALESIVLNR